MPYSAKQVSDLQAERDLPTYNGQDDATFLAAITAETVDAPLTSITAGQLFEAIVPSEFQTLSQAQQARVDRLLGLGAEVIIGPDNSPQAVQELLATFGGGSTTVQTLAALRDQKTSRAAELGLPTPILADVERTS